MINKNEKKQTQLEKAKASIFDINFAYSYGLNFIRDSIRADSSWRRNRQVTGSIRQLPEKSNGILAQMDLKDLDSLFTTNRKQSLVLASALRKSRNYKVNISSIKSQLKRLRYELERYKIAKFKKYSQAFACMVMFLIGAPLGAIIKKGGLGFPVIISIFFYIFYYVTSILSEKWAVAGYVNGAYSIWMSDLILLPVGLFFLRQARVDARLFDTDYYLVMIDKFTKKRFEKLKH